MNKTENMITCACGSTFHKYTLNAHLKTDKHRRFLGEDVPKRERKAYTRTKPRKPIDESKIWVFMHRKVADCTPEQLKRRREYIALKMREHRARKKAALAMEAAE